MKKKPIKAMISVIIILFIFPVAQVLSSTDTSTFSLEFLDNGNITLNAQDVPLETLLEGIQKNTGLEYKVHPKYLKQSISVRFQSLPFGQAIKRILHGVSYACIYDSEGKVEKIIAFSNADKSSKSLIHKTGKLRSFPYLKGVQITPSQEIGEIRAVMKIVPLPEVMKTPENIMKYGPAPVLDKTGGNMELTAPSEAKLM